MNLSMFRLKYAPGQARVAENGIDNVPGLVIETYSQGVSVSHFPHTWTWKCEKVKEGEM